MIEKTIIHTDDCAGWADPDMDFAGCDCVVAVIDALRVDLAAARKEVAAGAALVTTWMDRSNDLAAKLAAVKSEHAAALARADLAEAALARVRGLCSSLITGHASTGNYVLSFIFAAIGDDHE